MSRHVAICVATYRRMVMLGHLLESLLEIEHPPDCTVEIRVVDDDTQGSARDLVEHVRSDPRCTVSVRYEVEPEQNIAAARNRALEMGPAHLVAFIDDDEVAERSWLVELVSALDRTGADAVFGPVLGRCPPGTRAWIVRGGFFDKPVGRDGAWLHWRQTRTSNTLARGHWFFERGLRFDRVFGRSGGEDTDLFARIAAQGGRFAAAARAVVGESVEPERTNFAYLWRRSRGGGINFHRQCSADPHARSPVVYLMWRSVRAGLEAIVGLAPLIVGRPERLYRALLGIALASGGLEAWLAPRRAARYVAYGEATPAPRS